MGTLQASKTGTLGQHPPRWNKSETLKPFSSEPPRGSANDLASRCPGLSLTGQGKVHVEVAAWSLRRLFVGFDEEHEVEPPPCRCSFSEAVYQCREVSEPPPKSLTVPNTSPRK